MIMAAEQTQTETEKTENSESAQLPLSNEFSTKHPLQNQWQLWYYRPEKNKDWKDNLLDVTAFDTVEDFWALYNHIELASHLNSGSDYSVFKHGIKPMWEDDRNKHGGRWLFTFQKKMNRHLDEIWRGVLLRLIGEAFGEDSDNVCGAVINIRPKMDKISVWTRDKTNQSANLQIGTVLKKRTGYSGQLIYEAHTDTQHKTGSTARYLLNL